MKNYNIPIFVPHEGCKFNCIFCNQRRITGSDTPITAFEVERIITEHLKTLPANDRHIEAAFFGGSFTGISAEKQVELLDAAYKFVKSGAIDGIRLSTRPDYISDEILIRLKKYAVRTIELGVQSLDNEVLAKTKRGHTEKQVIESAELIKKYGFNLGLQMMTGLPGDTEEKSIKTARKIIALKPDCVRIYPTLVLKDTYLEKMYKNGEYIPQSLENAVNLCKKLLLMFRKENIDVIRVALVTTDEISPDGAIVAGPFHSSFRELCEGEIYFDRICELAENLPDLKKVAVNPKELSKAIGNRRRNILRIKEKYGTNLEIITSQDVLKGEIKVWKE